MESHKATLTLYYDGACHLCSREVNHYKKLNPGTLKFVDISLPEFEPTEELPSADRLNKYFHVQKPDGEFVEGIDAFVEIWKRLPQYRWASRAANQPLVRKAMDAGYRVFAEIRPLLPKRKKQHCPGGFCPL